jgi:hypothetical protein
MHIISYIQGITVDGAHLHFRNPRWYDVPERGFNYVIAKEEHILDDYRQMGVQPYALLQKEEREKQQVEEVNIEIHEDSKIIEDLSWNELRKLAKELSGEPIKNKEQAKQILSQHGW